MRNLLAGLVGLTLVGCAAADVGSQPVADTDAAQVSAGDDGVWRFEDHADDLRQASCPSGVPFQRAQALEIVAEAIDKGPEAIQADYLPGLVFAGAWQLSAEDANFGGLSGLAEMRSGTLLAINDAGAFVWIGIDEASGAPDGVGAIGYMLDRDGKQFARKVAADSEGLVLRDGLALVSFEQRHRVEAFDLESCGTAARAAPVVEFPLVIDGKKVPDNRGAEALAMDDQGVLWAGFEYRMTDGSPLGRVRADGTLDQLTYAGQPGLYLQTAADIRDGRRASLYRAYDPFRGARIIIEISGGEQAPIRAELKPPLPVDNFEGVAWGHAPDGGARLWLIADDNFNPTQRTLLFALDLVP